MFSVCARRLQSYKDTISCLYLRLGDQEEFKGQKDELWILSLNYFFLGVLCMHGYVCVVQHILCMRGATCQRVSVENLQVRHTCTYNDNVLELLYTC
jgi:hypothetical protein